MYSIDSDVLLYRMCFVWFEQQQQQQQHQQLMHGARSEMEPGGDALSTSDDRYGFTPTLPTAAFPRRGRRQAVYDPKV